MQSYTNLADFQTKLNMTANLLGLNYRTISIWIPYTRRDMTTMVYVNSYNSSQLMDPDMWADNYPAPGQDCVHCTYDACMDDGCGINQPVHVCSFPYGAPISQLQGLCSNTLLGKIILSFICVFINAVHKVHNIQIIDFKREKKCVRR